jgi:hypothetical protein
VNSFPGVIGTDRIDMTLYLKGDLFLEKER